MNNILYIREEKVSDILFSVLGNNGTISFIFLNLFQKRRIGEKFTVKEASFAVFDEFFKQISEYLDGRRKSFDIRAKPLVGTEFERAVWDKVADIPYGQVITYAELAYSLGNRRLARAVGQALGKNPLPVIIPCHRVVASSGKPGGFTAGIPLKLRLLKLEGVRYAK
ncbi:methylated-DNA--[protein]-cysteine S-methyltransferase [bacterium]|nr:methylated-DNA--[protein]-cysteine S-methyltransferase [bacterium]